MAKVILLIIAKTKIGDDFCYIAWDASSRKIVRPVLRPYQLRWLRGRDPELNVGEQHRFHVRRYDLIGSQYPHRTDDILVEYRGKLVIPLTSNAELYDILVGQSKLRVAEVFGELFGVRKELNNLYVEEGTVCPSVGIYRCKRADVHISIDYYNPQKKRCQISQEAGVGLEDEQKPSFYPRLTAVEDYALSDGDDLLVVLGLARPWDNHGEFAPRRCYMMAIGIISRQANALYLY